VKNEGSAKIYQLALSYAANLRKEVKDSIDGISKTASFSSLQSWARGFVSEFGTHYIDGCVMGGKITQESPSKGHGSGEGFRIALGVGIRYGALSIDINLGIGYDEKSFLNETTTNQYVEGGDPVLGDFVVQPGVTSSRIAMESWVSSISQNPVCTKFTTAPIYNVITDRTKKWFVCNAYEDALSLKASDRICSKPK